MTKIALAYAGPITFAALRFAIAPLCLLPMMLRMRVRVSSSAPLLPSLLALGAGMTWAASVVYALRGMSAGMASLGTLATPVVGVLCAWLQLGERPVRWRRAGWP